MYFWRIEKLKSEMAERPLSEREVLPYFVMDVVITAGAASLPKALGNGWDVLDAIGSILLAVAGSIYIYRRNGGAGGQHLLQRYMAVGWVMTVRWSAILFPAGFAFYTVLASAGAELGHTHWYDFLLIKGCEAGLYWRIGHHLGDLAQRTTPA